MKVNEYDEVLLKDGRIANIVGVLGPTTYLADVGDDPETWDTIKVELEEIEKVLIAFEE